jgi:hypothetical protein
VTATSVTVNQPHQLAVASLKLMEGVEALAGHAKFLSSQVALLAAAKEQASSSVNIYTALVALGKELRGYHDQLMRMSSLTASAVSSELIGNTAFQQHYVSLQLRLRELKSLLDSGATSSYSAAISSPLGALFWATHIGAQNAAIGWAPFFQVLQEVLGRKLRKAESFVKFMFDCNNENRVTTGSLNMFINWFDYDNMQEPLSLREYLTTLMARAEEVFFFVGFHGFVSRPKAERMLASQPPTSYIVRLSDSNAGVFILSYVDSKRSIRHRLLNQVNQRGFMVENQVFNTLPQLLASHSSVLALPIPNSVQFDVPNSIYGGGGALYDRLRSPMAHAATVKSSSVDYYASIAVSEQWIQVTLELSESELSILTPKAPLRSIVPLTSVTGIGLLDAMAGRTHVFVVTVEDGRKLTFTAPDTPDWLGKLQAATGMQTKRASPTYTTAAGALAGRPPRPVSASPQPPPRRVQHPTSTQVVTPLNGSADERLLANVVARRMDDEDVPRVKQLILETVRANGQPSPVDIALLALLNGALANALAMKGGVAAGTSPPIVHVSKVSLDMNLPPDSAAPVQVPIRDSIRLSNRGGTPVECVIVPPDDPSFQLRFVPDAFVLPAGSSVDVDITLVINKTTQLGELIHLSFGPGAGHASLFLGLALTATISEELNFSDLELGPKLGAGAFGQVFQGAYRDREVAVKAVNFEPDYDQEMGILREVRYHANIVEYIGACKRQPFQGFIVLEFMHLGSLDKYIHNRQFNLTVAYTLRVAQDIASGLAHLHRCKIMHLDMKPANVLVANLSPSAPTCVKLADFGLSQSRDTSQTFKGDYVEGTLLYMAPEMLREKLFSFKGDIFSYGMTMWEMIMRRQPYSGPKHRHLKKAAFEEVRERGELPGELSELPLPAMQRVLAAMFAYDHNARPSAEEVGAMVQKIRMGGK